MISDPFPPDTTLPCLVQPSPNHGDRKGRSIDSIILHYTGMPSAEAALERLCDRAAEVSSHYLVDEGGAMFQLVPEARRAWHAGRSYWQGERDMNAVSIGIEIANAGHPGGLPPYPDVQIAAVIALCRDIMARHSIVPARVLGHSDIAPGRKIDPGEHFPWRVLAESGVAVWPSVPTLSFEGTIIGSGARGQRIAALQHLLGLWGADIVASGEFDAATRTLVTELQRHFRPERIDGVADAEMWRLLQGLTTCSAEMERDELAP